MSGYDIRCAKWDQISNLLIDTYGARSIESETSIIAPIPPMFKKKELVETKLLRRFAFTPNLGQGIVIRKPISESDEQTDFDTSRFEHSYDRKEPRCKSLAILTETTHLILEGPKWKKAESVGKAGTPPIMSMEDDKPETLTEEQILEVERFHKHFAEEKRREDERMSNERHDRMEIKRKMRMKEEDGLARRRHQRRHTNSRNSCQHQMMREDCELRNQEECNSHHESDIRTRRQKPSPQDEITQIKDNLCPATGKGSQSRHIIRKNVSPPHGSASSSDYQNTMKCDSLFMNERLPSKSLGTFDECQKSDMRMRNISNDVTVDRNMGFKEEVRTPTENIVNQVKTKNSFIEGAFDETWECLNEIEAQMHLGKSNVDDAHFKELLNRKTVSPSPFTYKQKVTISCLERFVDDKKSGGEEVPHFNNEKAQMRKLPAGPLYTEVPLGGDCCTGNDSNHCPQEVIDNEEHQMGSRRRKRRVKRYDLGHFDRRGNYRKNDYYPSSGSAQSKDSKTSSFEPVDRYGSPDERGSFGISSIQYVNRYGSPDEEGQYIGYYLRRVDNNGNISDREHYTKYLIERSYRKRSGDQNDEDHLRRNSYNSGSPDQHPYDRRHFYDGSDVEYCHSSQYFFGQADSEGYSDENGHFRRLRPVYVNSDSECGSKEGKYLRFPIVPVGRNGSNGYHGSVIGFVDKELSSGEENIVYRRRYNRRRYDRRRRHPRDEDMEGSGGEERQCGRSQNQGNEERRHQNRGGDSGGEEIEGDEDSDGQGYRDSDGQGNRNSRRHGNPNEGRHQKRDPHGHSGNRRLDNRSPHQQKRYCGNRQISGQRTSQQSDNERISQQDFDKRMSKQNFDERRSQQQGGGCRSQQDGDEHRKQQDGDERRGSYEDRYYSTDGRNQGRRDPSDRKSQDRIDSPDRQSQGSRNSPDSRNEDGRGSRERQYSQERLNEEEHSGGSRRKHQHAYERCGQGTPERFGRRTPKRYRGRSPPRGRSRERRDGRYSRRHYSPERPQSWASDEHSDGRRNRPRYASSNERSYEYPRRRFIHRCSSEIRDTYFYKNMSKEQFKIYCAGASDPSAESHGRNYRRKCLNREWKFFKSMPDNKSVFNDSDRNSSTIDMERDRLEYMLRDEEDVIVKDDGRGCNPDRYIARSREYYKDDGVSDDSDAKCERHCKLVNNELAMDATCTRSRDIERNAFRAEVLRKYRNPINDLDKRRMYFDEACEAYELSCRKYEVGVESYELAVPGESTLTFKMFLEKFGFKDPKMRDITEFWLMALLGKGEISKTYVALEASTKRPYIIKKLTKYNKHCRSEMLKYKMEIEVCSRIKHPHIAQIKDFITYENNPVGLLLYDLYPMSLQNYMDVGRRHAVDQEFVHLVGKSMFDAIQYLHRSKIVHRNLKPENILINERLGHVVLADFEDAANAKEEISGHLSECFTCCWYCPPETLIDRNRWDESIDVWAMSVILCELYRDSEGLWRGITDLDSVCQIFSMIGTPTEETWPGCMDLTFFKNGEYNQVERQELDAYLIEAPREFIKLMNSVFQYNPDSRPTAYQLFTSLFYDGLTDEEDDSLEGQQTAEINEAARWYFRKNYNHFTELVSKIPKHKIVLAFANRRRVEATGKEFLPDKTDPFYCLQRKEKLSDNEIVLRTLALTYVKYNAFEQLEQLYESDRVFKAFCEGPQTKDFLKMCEEYSSVVKVGADKIEPEVITILDEPMDAIIVDKPETSIINKVHKLAIAEDSNNSKGSEKQSHKKKEVELSHAERKTKKRAAKLERQNAARLREEQELQAQREKEELLRAQRKEKAREEKAKKKAEKRRRPPVIEDDDEEEEPPSGAKKSHG
uniref:Protein kinase domain-containing protein n=1 Tax=Rhabditophanes sp. KR3021 TaxID=114890 RepID=A0AC35UDP0_9BILA